MTALHLRSARSWSSDDGLSLVELMAAMFVLAIGILALASVASASLVQLRVTRDRENATNIASSTLERLRSTDWDSLSIDDSGSGPAPTCFGDEPIIKDPSGTPFTQQAGPGNRFLVTTYVTWFDEDGVEPSPDCQAQTERIAKRIVVEATWSDRGNVRQVAQETVVAEAGRGLPVPDFELTPPVQPANFTPSQVNATGGLVAGYGSEQCVQHLLTNTGAEDSYEWELTRANESGVGDGGISPDGAAGYATNGAKWKVRALFEYASDRDPSLSTIDPSTQRLDPDDESGDDYEVYYDLLEDGADANSWPETTTRLPNREAARMWFCYRPKNGLSTGKTFVFDSVIHSEFDPNRFETVTHRLTVSDAPLTWYLFDPATDAVQADHSRPNSAFPMGVLEDASAQPAILGPQLNDWDNGTNQDPFGAPGVRIKAGDASTDVLWHQQFNAATVLASNVTLNLWTAPDEAFTVPASGARVRMQVTLERLRTNEQSFSPSPQILATQTIDYTHAATGDFEERVVSLVLSDGSFAAGQYLRLRVSCVSATGTTAGCHVGYDADTNGSVDGGKYESRLRVAKLS